MKDLTFKLRMDRSSAKASADAQVADDKRMARSAGETQAAMKAALDKQAAAQQAVSQGAVEGLNRARDAQGRFTAGAKIAGEEGSAAFNRIGASVAVMQVGLQKAMQVATAFGDAMKEAADRYKKFSDNFASDRDKLGELAGIMGKAPDNDFALRNAEFNKRTGMRFDEGIRFREAYHNASEQYKGRNISDAEHAQFEEQSAKYGTAKGIESGQVGDFAGTILGFKDRSKLGDRASEDALGKLNSATAILGAGKGRNSTLIDQTNRVAAGALNEDAMRGTFTDSDEVATAVSVAAEMDDKTAAEQIRAANRGLRNFDGKKSASLLSRAKIGPDTKFLDSIKQLAPVVEAEAKSKNVKIQDVLRDSFEDQLTAEAIGVQINKGVFGGAYNQRAKVAAENQGGDKALAVIGDAEKTERFQDRKADAGIKLAEDKVGAENSRVSLLRKEAIERATPELGTTWMSFGKKLSGITGGIISDPEENLIRQTQGQILQERAAKAGVKLSGKPLDPGATAEQANSYYNRQLDQIGKAKGGDGDKAMADLVRKTDETNALLRRVVANTTPGPVGTPPPSRPVGIPYRPTR